MDPFDTLVYLRRPWIHSVIGGKLIILEFDKELGKLLPRVFTNMWWLFARVLLCFYFKVLQIGHKLNVLRIHACWSHRVNEGKEVDR